MQKSYKVFSVHKLPTQTSVVLPDGTAAIATVDSLEVQLVPDDGASGTLKLNFIGAEKIAEAESLFANEAAISAVFSLA